MHRKMFQWALTMGPYITQTPKCIQEVEFLQAVFCGAAVPVGNNDNAINVPSNAKRGGRRRDAMLLGTTLGVEGSRL